jgi:1,4-dihydroxy-2-naphthoate octaprenyltransferase
LEIALGDTDPYPDTARATVRAVQREGSYWRGVQARLLPASAVGLVVGLLLWWVEDAGVALLVGLLSFASGVLLPSEWSRTHRT